MTPERAGSPLFTEPILVVLQAPEPVEDGDLCAMIYDQHIRRLAAVRQVGPSRRSGLQVVGTDGGVLLDVTPPAERAESQMIVADAAGYEAGRIIREKVFGRVRLALRAGGRRCGSINAGDLRGWNFAILDHAGTEVARITRTMEGLAAPRPLSADDHVLQFRRRLRGPLHTLVVAAALGLDTTGPHDVRGAG